MKKAFPFLLLMALVLLLPPVMKLVQAEPFGELTRDSEVVTYDESLYPVFEIHVPSPYTEVQIRASITNFEPGFLLKANGVAIYNFIPLVDSPKVNDRWTYRALGTTDLLATWNNGQGRFEITINGELIHFATGALEPWGNWSDAGGIDYTANKELFVYRTCTTGQAADVANWGKGSGDPDPWVFIPKQTADPGVEMDQFRRQKWDSATALSSQIGTAPSVWGLGNTIVFQPSRGNAEGCLGADEWMRQNLDRLVWVYQLETAIGEHQTQPNGVPIWHVMRPVEWRKSRITLPTP